jgi:dienelactone hydrolase
MRRVLSALAVLVSLATMPAMAENVIIPLADGTRLKAELFRPAQPSDKAAVILLHGCGGPYPARDNPWRDRFLAEGRVVLKPLSFASRGLGSQCGRPDGPASPYTVRRDDTIAAAQWLAAQPFTPPGGMVVMGFSHGGSTVLAAAEAMPPGLVRGYVALYPGCGVISRRTDWKPGAPLAIFIGEKDDWTLARFCRRLAEQQPPAAVQLTVYPDAYHDFDSPDPVRTRSGTPGQTVHIGNNPAAAEDVVGRVMGFVNGLGAVGR